MTHASIVPLQLDARRYYLYCASGGVVAVSADDGAIAWETASWKISIATVPSPVVMDDGRVMFTGGYGAGAALFQFRHDGGRLLGTEVWRVKPDVFGATQHSAVWQGGHLYGIRADGRWVCVTPEGRVAWESPSDTTFGLGPLLVAQGLIYALAEGGKLTLADARPDAFRSRAQAEVIADGHECWAPLALAGPRLIVRDLTRMVCLQVGP